MGYSIRSSCYMHLICLLQSRVALIDNMCTAFHSAIFMLETFDRKPKKTAMRRRITIMTIIMKMYNSTDHDVVDDDDVDAVEILT